MNYNKNTGELTINVADLIDDVERKQAACGNGLLYDTLDVFLTELLEWEDSTLVIPHHSNIDDPMGDHTLAHAYPEWDLMERQNDTSAYPTLSWLLFKNHLDDEEIHMYHIHMEPLDIHTVAELIDSLTEHTTFGNH